MVKKLGVSFFLGMILMMLCSMFVSPTTCCFTVTCLATNVETLISSLSGMYVLHPAIPGFSFPTSCNAMTCGVLSMLAMYREKALLFFFRFVQIHCQIIMSSLLLRVCSLIVRRVDRCCHFGVL
uniref:Secreted protein n=1 Tax=Ixodes ricinus TaxID=34613 RepID=A0A147BPT7_IXORI